ncbi:MAG: Hint domain-containing protein [Pseudomonadota bacterium]
MSTAVGQAGSLQSNTTVTNEPIQVTFDTPLDDPVIALMSTNVGGNQFALRVIDVQTGADGLATGFTFTIEEWENEDGPHPAVETINWIAIEEGVHTLPDGRLIEARHSDADSDGETVTFNAAFTEPPVVITTVASDNEDGVVDSDPRNITANDFLLDVEEGEGNDGVHGFEQVGWIAVGATDGTDPDQYGAAVTVDGIDDDWATGVDIGGPVTDAITVGEVQTQNGGDPGDIIFENQTDGSIDLRYEEEDSGDSETNHVEETVGLVTFQEGLILCFTPDALIKTPLGERPIGELKVGDLVLTRDRGLQPLRWMSSLTLDAARLAAEPRHRPVLIKANAIASGCPARDILVSPQHRMLIEGWRAELYAGEDEVFAPAVGLINDRTILRAPVENVTYVHLLFDRHEVIWADDAPSESLHPGALDRGELDAAAREELFALFPSLRTDNHGFGPMARPAMKVAQASVFV